MTSWVGGNIDKLLQKRLPINDITGVKQSNWHNYLLKAWINWAHANLLFLEPTVDDAAAQVVYPLPLDDVIKNELPAYGRLQLTWSHSVLNNVKQDVGCRQGKWRATWNRRNLFSGHPQEVSDVKLPDIKRNAVSLQLFDQLLFPMMAAAAQMGRHITWPRCHFYKHRLRLRSILPRRLDDVNTQYNFIGSRQKAAPVRISARPPGILGFVS